MDMEEEERENVQWWKKNRAKKIPNQFVWCWCVFVYAFEIAM